MKQILTALLLALTFNSQAMAQQKTIKIRVVETSDVHGCFFPYDFINRKPKAGSLARVSSYVDSLRQEYNDRLILLDNGDDSIFISDDKFSTIANVVGSVIDRKSVV